MAYDDTTLKSAAISYARMGLAVHALKPKDKRPHTKNGLLDANGGERIRPTT